VKLGDRTSIVREMRASPAVVAQELHELRALRSRAERLADSGPPQTNLGVGVNLAARIILGRVTNPEVWIGALTNLGDDKP
jgi:hypothetical protein